MPIHTDTPQHAHPNRKTAFTGGLRIIPNGTYFIGWPSSETTKLLPVTA
jgi:hypothetical protein